MENEIVLNAGNWYAKILPDFGMNMISLACGDRHILRSPQNMDTLKKEPYVYGIPLLFPANRVEKGMFTFDGKSYHFPINEPARNNHIHGLMFDAPFRLIEQTRSRVEAIYENKGERYPFPFSMTITDTLTPEGLTRKLYLKNTGDTAMPYTLAYHTSFAEPAVFSVPIGRRFVCNENYIPTGEMAELTAQEQEYHIGTCPKGKKISGFYTAAGHTAYLDNIRFTVSENFDEWVTFNAGGEQGFLCIEPQCGQVNGLNRPGGHRVLLPGETEEFFVSFAG